MALNDFFGDPQAEAGADIFLGGEEGFEDVIAMFGGDAGAVVFDDDFDDVGGRILVAIDADADGAAVGDGVGGVGDEVGDGLFELAGEGLDGRAIVEVADEDDVFGAEFVGVDVEDRLDEGGEIDFVGLLGFAIEAEGLTRDVGDAGEFFFGECEIGEGGFGDAFGGFGDVNEIADGFEGVIDLVRDGGSETGGGGELLGLAEDFLRFALGGGVAKDEDDADDFAAAVADGSGAVFDGDLGAVGILKHGMVGEADDEAVLHHFLDRVIDGLEGGLVEDGEDVFDVLAAGDGESAAHEFFGHGIEEGDVAATVGGDDGVAEAGEGGAEPLFALFELAGVDFALCHRLGDVVGEEEEAGGGDERGEVDGDVGVADAAARVFRAGGLKGGFLELNFADEVIDLDHDEAATVGEDERAGGIGIAGIVEPDGLGELSQLGLGEGAKLRYLSQLGRIFEHLLKEIKLGIELSEGLIVGVEVF